MKIFPAIDIKDKKCVRLLKGNFDNQTIYEQLPYDQASKYKDAGFLNLHIVDLDGALSGEPVNLDVIENIVKNLNISVEIGGGIRSVEKIKAYLNIGVEKVILGSAAIKNPNFLKEACEEFKGKIALGLDAKKGKLSVSGWKETTSQTAENYLKNVNKYCFSRLIYTDIDRDGTKTEPNIEETVKIAKISSAPVLVSGGISSIQDVKNIIKLKKFNIEGVIVGKAIYDGDIKLNELKELEDA
ncbi:MAG: phosphoribosylformimino-5-aminoimidazole carboxamide ribotide isomerase [Pelagibacterales bacterium]|nr:phosphoribosylformimino-5-aminoimidazole carboxamide ribotide isomerase [Pelagibacterales bacterium]